MIPFLIYFFIGVAVFWAINVIALGVCFLIRRALQKSDPYSVHVERIEKAIDFFKWSVIVIIWLERAFGKKDKTD